MKSMKIGQWVVTEEFVKDQIKSHKEVIKDIKKELKKETYETHKKYLMEQIETGEHDLKYYNSLLKQLKVA